MAKNHKTGRTVRQLCEEENIFTLSRVR
ncbi:MAG: hypothetical protein R3A45_02635 [Bdellovibrionota bacterium]